MVKLICSIAQKSGIMACTIVQDGTRKYKSTEKLDIPEGKGGSNYIAIYSFSFALRHLRQFLQDNNFVNSYVCFEVSNFIFANWVIKQEATGDYVEDFIEVMRLLNELPIKYTFTFNKKPRALPFADKKYLKKMEISGLDIEGVDD